MWIWQERPFYDVHLTNGGAYLPLTDLLHSILQLIALEEDDED